MKKLIGIILASAFLFGTALAQDTYVYQSFGGPASLDVARAYDTASGTIIENTYETMFAYDGDAIDVLVPSLATSFDVSDDALTYTFHLREGVKFHSGNEMTCKDVAWSWRYGQVTAHPEGATAYLAGDFFVGYFADGTDKDDYLANISWDDIQSFVQCPDGDDGYTVQLNLRDTTAAMLPILTYTAFSVVDSEFAIAGGAWDGTEDTWQDWIGRDLTTEFLHNNVSGTGAYKLVSWDGTGDVVLERFDDYWGGAPAIKNILVQDVADESTRILSVKAGDAHRVVINSRATLPQVQGDPNVTVHEEDDWANISVTSLFFNYEIELSNNEDVGSGQLDRNGIPADFFQDINVRRAFAHLFDQQELIDALYVGKGVTVNVGLPPSFLGYNPDVPTRDIDLEAAEAYFREAFGGELWEKGFSFTALYNDGNLVRQTVLEIVRENLEFINPKFRMNVRALPWPDFLSRSAERRVPLFALGWLADFADPSNYLDTFYLSNSYYAERTAINFPEIDELLNAAAKSLDNEERAELYAKVAEIQYDQVPLLPVPLQIPFLVTSSNLEGVYYNPMMSHNYLWKDISFGN